MIPSILLLIASVVTTPIAQLSIKENSSNAQQSNSSVAGKKENLAVNYAWLDQKCGSAVNLKAAPGALDPANNGLCCSSNNYAGFTSEHCGAGCRPAWGRCDTGLVPTVQTKCTTANQFVLTFDDGPSILTAGLLDYLKTVNVKATFFLNGLNWKSQTGIPVSSIYQQSAVVLRAYNEGHQICSHTWSHTDLITVSEYNVTYEMTRLNRAFGQILGKVPTCVRPPYGDSDKNALKILQGMGYGRNNGGTIVTWNVDPVDWDPSVHGNTIPAQIDDMTNEYTLQTPDFTSWITLQHDTHRTTADFRSNGVVLPTGAVPLAQRAVQFAKNKGYQIVRLDQCLGQAVGSMLRDPNANDICSGSCTA